MVPESVRLCRAPSAEVDDWHSVAHVLAVVKGVHQRFPALLSPLALGLIELAGAKPGDEVQNMCKDQPLKT